MRLRHRHILLRITLLLGLLPPHLQAEEDDRLPLSAPEHIIGLNPQPNILIDGMVHPLSGSIYLSETDLLARGAQPISLTRYFASPFLPIQYAQDSFHDQVDCYQHSPNFGGWSFLSHTFLSVSEGGSEVRVAEPNGLTLPFRIRSDGSCDLQGPSTGLHNVGPDGPSGRNDPRNTCIEVLDGGDRVIVKCADGSQREYHTPSVTPARTRRLLHREIFPNGKCLRYHYDSQDHLTKITSHDLQERFTYATLSQEAHPDHYLFTTSTGSCATYSLEVRQDMYTETTRLKRATQTLTSPRTSKPLLVDVKSPNYRQEKLTYSDRFLLDAYAGRGRSYRYLYCPHFKWRTSPHWIVQSIQAPIGEQGDYLTIYEIHCDAGYDHSCSNHHRVAYNDGAYDCYDHSSQGLITNIAHYEPLGELHYKECFNWTGNNWLASTLTQDSCGNILSKREYTYDSLGNPVEEQFSGDITGQGSCETLSIQRKFSDDGMHLLLEEFHENGLVKRYTYLPNTHLVTSELLCDRETPIQRHFREYDDCCNLIQEIVDDGSGFKPEDLTEVSERRITTYKLRQEQPFLHMREWVIESYWEGGIEKPLRKIHLHYDQWGNICQEDAYDANSQFAFSIVKEFDEQGNLVSETNPIGQQATHSYDSHGRLLTSTNFAGTATTENTYDAAGRLVEKKSLGADGLEEGVTYAYNPRSQCIQETNHLGHEIHYEYDPVSQKVVKAVHPPVAGLDGRLQEVVTSSGLDPFGREIAFTDARGNTIHKRLNAYGDPTWVEHLDSSVDQYRYDKKGQLASHTDTQGLEIRYARDVLGRIVLKSWHSPAGEELARETFTYNGYQLIEETDKEGRPTHYTYDGAGRKIEEATSGRVIRYSYDPLGRLEREEHLNDDQTLVVAYVRDLLGRVVDKTQQNRSGQILQKTSHTYDPQGNVDSTNHWTGPSEGATERWEYDSQNRLIAHVDELGQMTKTAYSEDYRDPVTGLRNRRVTTTYPSGRQVERVYDAYDHLVKEETNDPSGAVISAQELAYDPNGNLVEQRSHVYRGRDYLKTIKHLWRYDEQDRKIEQVEAAGSPDERSTSYSYLSSGDLQTKRLPGGVVLNYAYNPLGYLSALWSTGSDNNVAYDYERDRLGRLLRATDQQTGAITYRSLDVFGNVLEERLANGLTLKKTYDAFDRALSLTYPDGSWVAYEYKPLYLREVKRYNPGGQLLYVHGYKDYNLRGQLQREELMGALGSVEHLQDEKGRPTGIQSAYFSQVIEEYDLEGNPLLVREGDTARRLRYDSLSQLTVEESSQDVHSYAYDSGYNCVTKDGQQGLHNNLNQLVQRGELQCRYDEQGRLVEKRSSEETSSYSYDALDRLVQANRRGMEVNFTYDPLGRRLSKHIHDDNAWIWKDAEECYFYDGDIELGAQDRSNQITHARVLGWTPRRDIGSAIGVEIEGKAYAPIHDLQGNVRALIDPKSGSPSAIYRYTSFGEDLSAESTLENPWKYASKRWDKEAGLILFGKRYYDPTVGKWLTQDPAGFAQSMNLYNFCFNSPWAFADPNGEFVIAVPALVAFVKFSIELTAAAMVTYYGEKLVQKDLERQREKRSKQEASFHPTRYAGYPLALPQYDDDIFTNYYLTKGATETATSSESKKKPGGVYAPDRPLPRDEKSGEPKPDTDAPHTQLGTRQGSKGPYRQTREWGADGKEVKRTDWTDHGRPSNHPCPHDHVRKPNPTGGTLCRGNPEPFKVFRGT